jgi:hypothetical protein
MDAVVGGAVFNTFVVGTMCCMVLMSTDSAVVRGHVQYLVRMNTVVVRGHVQYLVRGGLSR